MADHIEVFDTTLRDGTQGEHVTLSAKDKIRIAKRLDQIGIDIIEGGWPGSNPKDQEFFERALDEEWYHSRICAFGSTRRAQNAPEDDHNLQCLLKAQTPVVSIFGKSWRLHAEVALGVTVEENLKLIHSSVEYLKAHGKHVVYDAEHFFDGYKDDADYAILALQAALEAGADTLVLCDTNGGILPLEIYRIVGKVADRIGAPLGIHTHNDAGCAVANSLTAIEAGARHVQGTISGIGERCGNAEWRAFAHKGGVHVSAVMKEPRAYEHITPELIGNKRRVLVSDLSGQSNIRYKAEELGITLTEKDQAKRAVKRIKELEHLGYEFEGAEASFELLIRTLQGEDHTYFELERLRVRSEDGSGGTCSEATLALDVGGKRTLVAAEGTGPVDAMSNALRQALGSFYPQLEHVRLSDYKVRVLTPEDGTAAQVRVLMEHRDKAKRWHTVGVSNNIMDASWQALSDGLRYHLYALEEHEKSLVESVTEKRE